MQRQYELFGDRRFERLVGLSNSHLYRLRHTTTYRRRRNPTTKTKPTQVSIGERRKPHPQGRAGLCGWTRFTKAPSMATRGCTKSTSWMK